MLQATSWHGVKFARPPRLYRCHKCDTAAAPLRHKSQERKPRGFSAKRHEKVKFPRQAAHREAWWGMVARGVVGRGRCSVPTL